MPADIADTADLPRRTAAVWIMSQGQPPRWFRLEHDFLDSPKFGELTSKHPKAVLLWLHGVGYASRHLTDGWLPESFPVSRGCRNGEVAALVRAGLWHPMEIADIGGWLINDYLEYQPSKEAWERVAVKRSAAARMRWEKRNE